MFGKVFGWYVQVREIKRNNLEQVSRLFGALTPCFVGYGKAIRSLSGVDQEAKEAIRRLSAGYAAIGRQ